MHPIDKRVREDLETLGDRGRAAAGAAWDSWSARHPTKPCARCSGHGNYTESPDGVRRPFDHRDFKPGDRYEATCPDCRGGGKIPCTVEERDAAEAERLEALRAEYRAIRAEICKLRSLELAAFDRIARRNITSSTPSPEEWLAAARIVRSIYL